jgi:hypothetical protein
MFPELSKKAWTEIFSDCPGYGAYYFYEAFRSLFDLEKYPITYEMLFKYLKDHPQYMDNYSNGSTVKDWAFMSINRQGYNVGCGMTVKEIITLIALTIQKDQIIIIGEIHGWWEKGETQ